MHYPLHLGVTEAGDGEDGRIKSAIGIGSLLLDGLGDTIRVSLTEDSVYEIPVARALAAKAMSQWREGPAAAPTSAAPAPAADGIDPYAYTRRAATPLELSDRCRTGPDQPPRVIVRLPSAAALAALAPELASPRLKDTPVEGLLLPIATPGDLAELCATAARVALAVDFLALELAPALTPDVLQPLLALSRGRLVLTRAFAAGDVPALRAWMDLVARHDHYLACEIAPADLASLAPALRGPGPERLLFTFAGPATPGDPAHAIGRYRRLAEALRHAGLTAPIWIRNTPATAVLPDASFLSRLLEASVLTGALLCDGLGDLVSIETEADPLRANRLAYNVLQGAGVAQLEDRVRRLPELRPHPLRPPDHHPADPRTDRSPQGRQNRHHGLHRKRPRRNGRRGLRLRRRRTGPDQPLRRPDLRAVQHPPGRGRRPPDRPHQGARQMGRPRPRLRLNRRRPVFRKTDARHRIVTFHTPAERLPKPPAQQRSPGGPTPSAPPPRDACDPPGEATKKDRKLMLKSGVNKLWESWP
jgi:4-hydroxy-3-methylbut-2-en-1-yl diphosphate synthase IspG/GcpE